MAVTKTHPIKSTLKAAIDYICNPDKTDGKLLVSSFGCAAETADIEFEWTRRHAIDKGTHLGRHLIQAFEPGEVLPDEAHEIGMQLAKEILGGKYEFVLTTHIDKGHIHNHLIFNAVSFTDHKHYHSNKRSYHEIRRASDRLCREHGLSVIVPGHDKGKSYIEHQAAQNGTSYKAKLKAAIDRLIPVSSSLEDLLARLHREGYEIKRGKYISARAPDQERFTRLKTLGANYTEEAIIARIAGGPKPSRQPRQRSGKVSLLISSPVVSFTDKTYKGGEDNYFHHRMSRITLTFEAGDGVDFSVVKPERYTLDGLLLTGTFNTADGIATADNGAQTGELAMNLADGNLTSSVILFPQTVASLPLVVNYKGQEYPATLTMPEGALLPGNNYTYTVKVSNKVLEVSEATIAKWNDINGGEVDAGL